MGNKIGFDETPNWAVAVIKMFTYPRFSCMWRYRNNNNTYKVNLSFSKLNTSSLFYFLEWSLFCILNAYHASPIGLLKLANIILNTHQHANILSRYSVYFSLDILLYLGELRLRLKIECVIQFNNSFCKPFIIGR